MEGSGSGRFAATPGGIDPPDQHPGMSDQRGPRGSRGIVRGRRRRGGRAAGGAPRSSGPAGRRRSRIVKGCRGAGGRAQCAAVGARGDPGQRRDPPPRRRAAARRGARLPPVGRPVLARGRREAARVHRASAVADLCLRLLGGGGAATPVGGGRAGRRSAGALRAPAPRAADARVGHTDFVKTIRSSPSPS